MSEDLRMTSTEREDYLRSEISRLSSELVKWQRIRTPTHGSCCTCQKCGLYYDSCRCDLDEVADENSILRNALMEIYEASNCTCHPYWTDRNMHDSECPSRFQEIANKALEVKTPQP